MFAVIVLHDDEFYTVLPFATDQESIDEITWQCMANFRDDDCSGCDAGDHDGHTVDFKIYDRDGTNVTEKMAPRWAKGEAAQ
ncbi:hypothetical protein KGQ34_02710 [Patescibacteria group bacterium]|nr:hypothetical protein [Patescibacteria group bacterium]